MLRKVTQLSIIIIFVLGAIVSSNDLQAQALNNTDYKKALWMTTRFYGAQRSGDNNWVIYNHLPDGVNASLRGRAFRADADGSVDLSGGWHDCGDHVKFGHTQFYSAYMLLKAYAEFKEGFDDHYSYDYAGYKAQSTAAPATGWTFEGNGHDPNGIPDILDEVKHATDFFIKCTPNGSNFYYQVGTGGGNADHATNNTAVKIQTLAVNQGGNNDNGSSAGPLRPTYKNPNDGAMASFCAATLALMSRMYEPFDPAYAALCLTHAQHAYTYASNHVGQAAGTGAGGFYTAHDNARNPWAICLSEMFLATNNNTYRTTAHALTAGNNSEQVRPNQFYSFDYSNVGELALYTLAQINHPTALAAFNSRVTNHWLNNSQYGGNGNYVGGGGWGQLRYTANAGFIIALHKKINNLPNLDAKAFANIDYILGANSANRSFVVGYEPSALSGVSSAQKPHHRNVFLRDDNPSGGAFNSIQIPAKNRQFGAMVGGNKTNPSSYNDDWTEYVNTEVCIDYNAGLVGALGAIMAQVDPIDPNKFLTQCASPGDLGGDQSLCGVGSIVLNTGLSTATNRTFQWFRNEVSQGAPSVSATSRTITQAGTWRVVVDSAGQCQRSATVVISGTLPTVSLGDDIELCDPSSATLDAGIAGAAINYTWTKNGSATPIATTQTLVVTEPGTYSVSVSATGCASQSDQVVVSSLLPVVQNDTICAPGSASLEVLTGSGPFEWYANQSGGSPLFTGNPFTPSITNTSTYYVVDAGSFDGNVGPTTRLDNGTNWGISSGNQLLFTVEQDFTINSLKVHYGSVYGAQSNATITVEVLQGNGTPFTPARTFTSVPRSVSGAMANSLIKFDFEGFTISQAWGNNLRMRFSAHTNIGDIMWNTTGASFPYVSNPAGVVTLTGVTGGTGANSNYMYFYDWEISSGVSCARRAVQAVIDVDYANCDEECTPPTDVLIQNGTLVNLCVGESVNLTTNNQPNTSDFDFTWFRGQNTSGTIVNGPEQNIASLSHTVTYANADYYTVRVRDRNQPDNVECVSTATVQVVALAAPTASITTSGNDLNYCSSVNGVTLNASNAGAGATYEWFRASVSNGTPQTTNTLANAIAGEWTVVVRRNGCEATSTPVNVLELTPPTASITTSGNDLNYCSSVNGITLTASNAGAGATYEWFLDNTSVGTPQTTNTLANAIAGEWTVVVRRNGCEATSTPVMVNSTTAVTPSVSIQASSTSICAGEEVTFSITDSNFLGDSPSYSWLVNGDEQAIGASFISNTINNNDEVRLIATSDLTCVSNEFATSNTVEMSVSGTVTPSVTIENTSSATLCAGETFTASITNSQGGGSTPSYVWLINGNASAQTGNNFSSATLSDGDIVSVELTSSSTCATSSSAISNEITVNYSLPVTPTIVIATDKNTICANEEVTVSVTSSEHLGANPVYTWLINGQVAGQTTIASFTSTLITSSVTISVSAESTLTCVTELSAVSNNVAIEVSAGEVASVSIQASSTSICESESVEFTINNSSNLGSNPSYRWLVNGAEQGTTETFASTSLSDQDMVSLEVTSNATCVAEPVVVSNAIEISVSTVTPSVTIENTSAATLCEGETFTASITNSQGGGSTPSYVWLINGNASAQTGNNFSSATLSDGDIVSVELTSSSTCATSSTAVSNEITVNYSLPVTPTIVIEADKNTICANEEVTVSVTSSEHLGTNPVYIWLINGQVAGQTTIASFTSTLITSSVTISVSAESTLTCVTEPSAISNNVAIEVSAGEVASVSIQASSTSICESESVEFTINNSSNLGSNPSYRWLVNGAEQGTTETFSSTSLSDQDMVSLEVTSNATCVTEPVVVSNAIEISVSGTVTPSVTIENTSSATLCAGETFTASITNSQGGGSTPSYVWLINGNASAQTGNNFSSAALSDGDIVSVELTSSSTCATSSTAVSNEITVNYSVQLTPEVVITVSQDVICAREPVTFEILNASNLSTNAVYTWLNGTNTVHTGMTYATTTLTSTDQISLRVSNIEGCVSATTVNSNSISVQVNEVTNASLAISADKTSICEGEMVNFTISSGVGLGTDPSYSWRVNGNEVTTTASYSSDELNHLDQIQLIVASSLLCVNPEMVESNTLTINVNQVLSPTVTIAANNNPVCESGSSRVTATVANAGTSTSYRWYRNNQEVTATTSSVIFGNLQAGDEVYVDVTTSSTCLTSTTVSSNTVTFSTTNRPAEPTITGAATLCASNNLSAVYSVANNAGSTYSWTISGPATLTGQGTSQITVNFDSVITTISLNVIEVGLGGCTGPSTSKNIALEVCTSVDDIIASYSAIELYPNPFNDFININLSSVQDRIEVVEVFDMKGNSIYQIQNPASIIELGSSLKNGHYIIRITGQNSVITRSLVKMN